MAVLAEERLDSPEDTWIADRALDCGTAVEHLITERLHLPNVVVGIPHIRGVLGKDPFYIPAEGRHGRKFEDAPQHRVTIGFEVL